MKTPSVPTLSNCTGLPANLRTHAAAKTASKLLLINQQIIIGSGTSLCNCAAQCAGNADNRTSHHARIGVSNKAASTMAFGGHNTETGNG